MHDVLDIIKNVQSLYSVGPTLGILKDFERVLDELDVYVYDGWLDGELVAGPNESRYFVECTFMWPYENMPEPQGGKRLKEYGCKVGFAESAIAKVRKIKAVDDIRPGTRKGKIDYDNIWMVKIAMPKRLMKNIDRGYKNLDRNKVDDILANNAVNMNLEPAQEVAAQQEAPADDTAAQ